MTFAQTDEQTSKRETIIGLIGLGTMGANLARNAGRNGAVVAVYNRTGEKTDAFMQSHGSEGKFIACRTIDELLSALPSPRTIILMVNAGSPVDDVIKELTAHSSSLIAQDAIIDAGNSHYKDTERREKELKEKGIHFLGMGVSGGEEGALLGPSMMPGGDRATYERLLPLLQKMSAKDGSGGKCVAHVGSGGAGHFVKMVHNGIEYGIMQLIAEAYDILKTLGGFSNAQLATTFNTWRKIPALDSFLIEITAQIFTVKDPETGLDLIDMIKDKAAQKGTGKWTTEASFDLGQATPTIDVAVTARILSADPKRSYRQPGQLPRELNEKYDLLSGKDLEKSVGAALECSVICAYNQGFHLIEKASETYQWNIPIHEVARIWRGGCIIRSAVLEQFQRACRDDSDSANIIEKEILKGFSDGRQRKWRTIVANALSRGIPVAAMAASLSYYDTISRERLPQNLIQAQRDFFGAHTFERIDKEGVFHTHWSDEKL